MSDPFASTVLAVMPVTLPHPDRVLMLHNAFIAITGARAYPQSVML